MPPTIADDDDDDDDEVVTVTPVVILIYVIVGFGRAKRLLVDSIVPLMTAFTFDDVNVRRMRSIVLTTRVIYDWTDKVKVGVRVVLKSINVGVLLLLPLPLPVPESTPTNEKDVIDASFERRLTCIV